MSGKSRDRDSLKNIILSYPEATGLLLGLIVALVLMSSLINPSRLLSYGDSFSEFAERKQIESRFAIKSKKLEEQGSHISNLINGTIIGFCFLMGIIVLGLLLICLWLLPSIVAFKRKKRNRKAILVFNLILGWFFFFWAIAITWAFLEDGILIAESSVLKSSVDDNQSADLFIKTRCPACNQKYKFDISMGNEQYGCSRCLSTFIVPASSDTE